MRESVIIPRRRKGESGRPGAVPAEGTSVGTIIYCHRQKIKRPLKKTAKKIIFYRSVDLCEDRKIVSLTRGGSPEAVGLPPMLTTK